MSYQRPLKRQRKKEAAAVRRQALLEAAQRRRRTRIIGISSATAALVLGGAAIAFVATSGNEPEATPKPTPSLAPTPAPIACGGKLPPAAGSQKQSYEKAEDQKLNAKKTYLLRLETSCGTIDVKLAHTKSPKTANSIAFLARKGFYDGLTFHRIVPGFVAQGGDPKGDGTGGPGYKTEEAPAKTQKYTKGVVAMAKGGNEPAGTSGSQLFIVTGDKAATLTPDYALLGEVVAGMEAAAKIDAVGAGEGAPPQKVFIEKATIIEQ